MSRTIKYRMFFQGDMIDEPTFGGWGNYKLNEALDGTKDSDGNEYIVMQFIGLKDKNKVEIYEDDIVKYQVANIDKPDEFTGQVIYSELSAMFLVDLFGFRQLYLSNLEVIGNIHENPELLKS